MEPVMAHTFQPGITLDDCRSLTEIRRGRYSAIYTAHCVPLDATVAVKIYDLPAQNPKKHRMAAREANMLRHLGSQGVPNITQLWGAYTTPEQAVLVLEYCAGGNLLDALRRRERGYPEAHVAGVIVAPLLRTLSRLHRCGVVHRDIKLENVFLDAAGRPRLGDYDLAVMAAEAAARGPVGTIYYMAPEVLRLACKSTTPDALGRGVNEKMDVWSLGVCVFELVAGYKPFQGTTFQAIAAAILSCRRAPLPPTVSPELVDFIDRCLVMLPGARSCADELAHHPWFVRNGVPTTAVAGRSDSAGSLEEVHRCGTAAAAAVLPAICTACKQGPDGASRATPATCAAATRRRRSVDEPLLPSTASAAAAASAASSGSLASSAASYCALSGLSTSMAGFTSGLLATGLSRTLMSASSSMLIPYLSNSHSLPTKSISGSTPPSGTSFLTAAPSCSTLPASAAPPHPLRRASYDQLPSAPAGPPRSRAAVQPPSTPFLLKEQQALVHGQLVGEAPIALPPLGLAALLSPSPAAAGEPGLPGGTAAQGAPPPLGSAACTASSRRGGSAWSSLLSCLAPSTTVS